MADMALIACDNIGFHLRLGVIAFAAQLEQGYSQVDAQPCPNWKEISLRRVSYDEPLSSSALLDWETMQMGAPFFSNFPRVERKAGKLIARSSRL
jgi:hypothetical protein